MTGDVMSGDIVTSDSVTGDSATGDSVTGDSVTGDSVTGDVAPDGARADEPPAVRLTMLGDPNSTGVCADGVCSLPPVTVASGLTPAEAGPDPARARDGAEPGWTVPSAPPARAGDR
mgnify:CR=1 FL=1